jgi:hypothetical protein
MIQLLESNSVELNTDSPVFLTHVVVNAMSFVECLQAHPADVSVAPSARHMVAPLAALDGDVAARTELHVVLLRPLSEGRFAATAPSIALRTLQPLV